MSYIQVSFARFAACEQFLMYVRKSLYSKDGTCGLSYAKLTLMCYAMYK